MNHGSCNDVVVCEFRYRADAVEFTNMKIASEKVRFCPKKEVFVNTDRPHKASVVSRESVNRGVVSFGNPLH